MSCSVVMDLGPESDSEEVMLDDARSFTINRAEEGLPLLLCSRQHVLVLSTRQPTNEAFASS